MRNGERSVALFYLVFFRTLYVRAGCGPVHKPHGMNALVEALSFLYDIG
jgi:hypothetical protein